MEEEEVAGQAMNVPRGTVGAINAMSTGKPGIGDMIVLYSGYIIKG